MKSITVMIAVAGLALAGRPATGQAMPDFLPAGRHPKATIIVLPEHRAFRPAPALTVTAFIDLWPRGDGSDLGASLDLELPLLPPPVSVFAFASPCAIFQDRAIVESRSRSSTEGGEAITYTDSVLVETLQAVFSASAGAGVRLEAPAGRGLVFSFSAAGGIQYQSQGAAALFRADAGARWRTGAIEIHARLVTDVTAAGIARIGAGVGAGVVF